ncbi:MAG: aminotransferase class I/II-fold pyridoxal phosphate-dependent enzyme [Alphaproteobacteria bacterium]|nr:aminotransferase class I/II-fold pyridoxal phosphate-dependent enzyme [Alphaproteobacteria bacterium]
MAERYHPETAAVHAGRVIDPGTGAVAPPIHLSTTFERDPDGSYPRGYSYSTFDNPNRAWLEDAITQLEGGAAAIATSSGMAAIAAVLSALKPGERVIVSYDLFQGTARLLNDQLRQWGIAVDVVDVTRLDEVAAAISPQTRMIWIDTPSNPLIRVTDIAGVVALARPKGVRVAVDSTFATFVLQRPLDHGADVAVYAATKYIAGHSDVVNGLAVFREKGALYERARAFQINVGLTPSPFDCWMVHRGLRTLPHRMRVHSRNAQAVSEFLEGHPRVARVYYPGLGSNEGWQIARRQMPAGCGGMLSASVKGGRAAAIGTVARVKLFTRAASLGGVESLIEHRASSPIQTRGQGTGFTLPDDLLRLSVGIEHADDLIADLDQALDGNWAP